MFIKELIITEHEKWLTSQYNEATTKKVIIEPIFQTLGWNFSDTTQVHLEDDADGDKIDYVLYGNDVSIPQILIEAKKNTIDIDKELKKRASLVVDIEKYKIQGKLKNVPIIIITNGLKYRIYVYMVSRDNYFHISDYDINIENSTNENIELVVNKFLMFSRDSILSNNHINTLQKLCQDHFDKQSVIQALINPNISLSCIEIIAKEAKILTTPERIKAILANIIRIDDNTINCVIQNPVNIDNSYIKLIKDMTSEHNLSVRFRKQLSSIKPLLEKIYKDGFISEDSFKYELETNLKISRKANGPMMRAYIGSEFDEKLFIKDKRNIISINPNIINYFKRMLELIDKENY